MAIFPPCDECGSTSFDEEDGRRVCENGHFQEGGQRTGEDDGDYAIAGKINRRKVDRSGRVKVLKTYRGAKGYRLFLLAWQHVLWRQCHVCVHDKGLPAELWTLIRELWTLRLSYLTNRLEDSNDLAADSTPGQSAPSTPLPPPETGDDVRVMKTARTASDSPTLWDTVALLYVGILLLRRPVTLATIYEWIRREDIPYIRAIRHVPKELKERLAPEHHVALDTTVIPQKRDLQLAVYQTATLYGHAFGMSIPPLNWKLILYQHIQSLALPLEVFPAAVLIANLAKFDFTFPSIQSERRTATSYPEAQIVAVLIVATQLLFPFERDTVTTGPFTSSEPAAVQLDWTAWQQEQMSAKLASTPSSIELGKEIEVTDRDILKMSDVQLDSYMDWFQRTYVEDVESNNDVNKQILGMFPLKDLSAHAPNHAGDQKAVEHDTIQKLRGSQSHLRSIPAILNEDESDVTPEHKIIRPGQRYQRIRDTQDMSAAAVVLYNNAADLACLDVDVLIRAVIRTERLLLRVQLEQRRRSYFGLDPETNPY